MVGLTDARVEERLAPAGRCAIVAIRNVRANSSRRLAGGQSLPDNVGTSTSSVCGWPQIVREVSAQWQRQQMLMAFTGFGRSPLSPGGLKCTTGGRVKVGHR